MAGALGKNVAEAVLAKALNGADTAAAAAAKRTLRRANTASPGALFDLPGGGKIKKELTPDGKPRIVDEAGNPVNVVGVRPRLIRQSGGRIDLQPADEKALAAALKKGDTNLPDDVALKQAGDYQRIQSSRPGTQRALQKSNSDSALLNAKVTAKPEVPVNPNAVKSVADVDPTKATKAQIDDIKAGVDDVLKNPNAAADLAAVDNVLKSLDGAPPSNIGTATGTPGDPSATALTKLDGAVDDAARAGRISARVRDKLKNGVQWARKNPGKIVVAGGLSAILYFAFRDSSDTYHSETREGCYLYDHDTGAFNRVDLLTCGNVAASTTAMPTCATQSFTAGSTTTINECEPTQFNPCAKTAKSRSTVATTPMVPNVCDTYLYKGTAPTAVDGVTTRDACKTETGAALPPGQTCSPYCKTENFDLDENQALICYSGNFLPKFIELASALKIEPHDVTGTPPPGTPPPPGGQAKRTKILTIAAASVGGLAFVLMCIWVYLKYFSRQE